MKKQELLKLMKAWVFDHANEMIEEFNMGRSEAFRQAYLVYDLLEKLGQGEVTFLYKKKNGDDRLARGTLCHGVSAAFDAYEYKGKTNRDCYPKIDVPYWDLDKQAFRSFSIASVKEIVSVVIK